MDSLLKNEMKILPLFTSSCFKPKWIYFFCWKMFCRMSTVWFPSFCKISFVGSRRNIL